MTAVDIFAGIQPMAEMESVTALFTHDPAKLSGFAAPILPCPAVNASSEVEHMWFEAWREYIDNNRSIVMRWGYNINDPLRYYPNVRAFIEENNIIFGSGQMYKVLADAVVSQSAVGTDIKLAQIGTVNLPTLQEYTNKIRYLTSEEDNALFRPLHGYYSDSFVFVEGTKLFLEGTEEIPENEGAPEEGGESAVPQKTPEELAREEYERICRVLFADAYYRDYFGRDYLKTRLDYLWNNPSDENNAELARITDPTYVLGFDSVRYILGVHNYFSFDNPFIPVDSNNYLPPYLRLPFLGIEYNDIINPHTDGNKYMLSLYYEYMAKRHEQSYLRNTVTGKFLEFIRIIEAADESTRTAIANDLNVLYINIDDLLLYGPYLGTPFGDAINRVRSELNTQADMSRMNQITAAIISLNTYGLQAQLSEVRYADTIHADAPEVYFARLQASLKELKTQLDYNVHDGEMLRLLSALGYIGVEPVVIQSGNIAVGSDLHNALIELRGRYNAQDSEGKTSFQNNLSALGIYYGDLLYGELPQNSPFSQVLSALYDVKKLLAELEADQGSSDNITRLMQLNTNLRALGIEPELIRGFDGNLTAILNAVREYVTAFENDSERRVFSAALRALNVPEEALLSLIGMGGGEELTDEMYDFIKFFSHRTYSMDFFISYNVSMDDALKNLDFFGDDDEEDDDAGHLMVLSAFYRAQELWEFFIQNNVDIIANPELPYNNHQRYRDDLYMDLVFHSMRTSMVPFQNSDFGTDKMYFLIADMINEGILEVRDLSYYCMKRDYSPNVSPTPVKRELVITESVTLLEFFLTNETVTFAFWGITLISIALCIIFSIYEVLRSMGDLEGQKPVSKVLGLAGKSMLTFLIIPFFVIASVSLMGVVMRQADSAIYDGADRGDLNLAGAVFFAAVPPEAIMVPGEKRTLENFIVIKGADPSEGHIRNIRIEQAALPSHVNIGTKMSMQTAVKNEYLYGEKGKFTDIGMTYRYLQSDFDAMKLLLPGNLIMVTIAAWFMVIMMLLVMFVFIRRVFELILLYIVAPFFVSTIPLDDGEVFKGWRERFISTLIMGFGSLLTFKIFIILVPVMWEPSFRLNSNLVLDYMLKTILMMGGIYAVYKSNSLISSIVSPDAAEGEKGTMAWVAATAGTAATMAKDAAKEIATVATAAAEMPKEIMKSAAQGAISAVPIVGKTLSKVTDKLPGMSDSGGLGGEEDAGGGDALGGVGDMAEKAGEAAEEVGENAMETAETAMDTAETASDAVETGADIIV